MAKDNKYGDVVLEHGNISEDEPIFVFRARDIHLPDVLDLYHTICKNSGSPERHLELINESMQQIMDWQNANPDKVRIPNSEASRAWRK